MKKTPPAQHEPGMPRLSNQAVKHSIHQLREMSFGTISERKLAHLVPQML